MQLFITSTGHCRNPDQAGIHMDICVDGERHAFNGTHTPTWHSMALSGLVPAKLGVRHIQVRRVLSLLTDGLRSRFVLRCLLIIRRCVSCVGARARVVYRRQRPQRLQSDCGAGQVSFRKQRDWPRG